MQEYIQIKGARENNLKDVSLRIPKRQITVFTGVSGSGKSSLVFDTIAAEAQRLLNENFSMFVRGFLPRLNQPQADDIQGLGMAVIVDQKRLGGGSHSTVGTVTDISTAMRLLFSRVGQPYIGGANLFSFNDPSGMCPDCVGMGRKMAMDRELVLDRSKSIDDGAIKLPGYEPNSFWTYNIMKAAGVDTTKRLSDFTASEMADFLDGEPRKLKVNGVNLTFEGLESVFTKKYILRDLSTMSERTQKTYAPFITMGACHTCGGARLSQTALSVRVAGHGIAELSAMQIDTLLEVVGTIKTPEAKALVATLRDRLKSLVDIGLGYLSLDRVTDTLSGGESQRVKMVKHLNGSLVDVMYVFDEPSVGLHPRDVHQLNELLRRLRDRGNTVLVVEHDPDVIAAADHVVDMGPGAGGQGGQVVFQGSYQDLLKADTLTGHHLKDSSPIKTDVRKPTGSLQIRDAHANNLQHIDVDIPTGVFTVITGVAGSGKSSLIHQVFLRQHPEAVVVDQSPVGVSNRSNPATYSGIMDVIRKAFAGANGADMALFSFNSKGACDNCRGAGFVTTDLAFLDDAKLPCEVCDGRRFKPEVLAYTYHGKNISQILELTVAESIEFFDLKEIASKLAALSDVGLDYLTLGQPLSSLSGGECQRLKLASELHKKGSIYVLDEPTTGLHPSDIARLHAIIDRLVEAGNTVITIEHNQEVIRRADWVIDLGPEGGQAGGRVMFEGTPAELAVSKTALIAKYL
jgi:excinuclease UvrABC ATPase subunit